MNTLQHVRFDPANDRVFLSSCGRDSDIIKLYTSTHLDQVNVFQPPSSSDKKETTAAGAVRFVVPMITPKGKGSKFLIGFQSGMLNTISVEYLSQSNYIHLPLDPQE